MNKRKICIITGSRAEYGLLFWILKELKEFSEVELQIIATGSHLSPEHGLTYRQIEKDGFEISQKLEMQISSNTTVGVTKSVGLAVIGFADAFSNLAPDICVVLGDRYEILAATQAAMLMNIPIAHIHGGETTEGAVDESIRHAISKMSHVHFVAAEPYRQRVLQMGENPNHVFNFGAPGIDSIKKLKLLNKEEWSQQTGFTLSGKIAAITFHPETLSDTPHEAQFSKFLKALEVFSSEWTLVFTKANADAGGHIINQMIDAFVSKGPANRISFASLGPLLYLSLLKNSSMVIGNSSSGIAEAPSLGVVTVNVGDRQKGRLMASSVLNCKCDEAEIGQKIRIAQEIDLNFVQNPYDQGQYASGNIAATLRSIALEPLLKKHFFVYCMENIGGF